MSPQQLAELMPSVNAWWLLLAAGVGPAARWVFGALLSLRSDRRADTVSTSEQMGRLITLLGAELDRASVASRGFRDDLDRMRQLRYALEDQIDGLRDAAVAARVMVHELERRLGLPETSFAPLPHPLVAAARAPPAE